MVDKLFDERSSNIFINSTLQLVDDALYFLRKENDNLKNIERTMSPSLFAQEFRTVHVRCRRRMGHTHLVNQLAYGLGSSLGCKYSTVIVVPNHAMAREMYGTRATPFEPEDKWEALRTYANVYENTMRSIPSLTHFTLGKVVISRQLESLDFKSHEFIEYNKQVITELTMFDMTNKKIDLVCVDCASMLSEEKINRIYDHFGDKVELFLFLG